MTHGHEKSGPAVVAVKPANEAERSGSESAEPRAGAEGNAGQQSTRRTQDRESVTEGLERVRQAARQRKKERFTALLHHVDVDRLRTAFYALERKAAPGVDRMTWKDYEADLEPRLAALHDRVHRGSYRPLRRDHGETRRLNSAGASTSWRQAQAEAAPTPNPCQLLASGAHCRFERFQWLAQRHWEFLALRCAATDSTKSVS